MAAILPPVFWSKFLNRWAPIAGPVILITGGLGLVVHVWQLPARDQSAAVQFWGFALTTVLGAVINLVSKVAKARTPAQSPPVDEQLRQLATALRDQWEQAAKERQLLEPAPLPIRWCRSKVRVSGPVSAATEYARFDPLPGLTAVSRSEELCAGDQDALHRVYGGLPSGRLLLIGRPGAGKSAAAILLLRDALRHREKAKPEDQGRIPVPVLFTLHGWDPGSGESIIDWMVGKLAQTYRMFASRAGRRAARDLLTDGRLAVFLDGMDEIPEPLRPRVLKALADAPFRLVLLSRTEEAVNVAKPLAGAAALELQPVEPTDAAKYLCHPLHDPPPESWQAVIDHLTAVRDTRRQPSALSEALSTPLALSLLRDAYKSASLVDELLNTTRFPSAASIEDHLIDRSVEQAYTPQDGRPRPRYSVDTA